MGRRPVPDRPRPFRSPHTAAWALLAVTLWVSGAVAVDFAGFLRRPLALPAGGAVLELAPGTSLARLARDLAARGWLDRPRYLALLGRLRGDTRRLQAGEYEVPAGTTAGELLDLLVSGRVRLYRFTIVEGWTFAELRQALKAAPALERRTADWSGDRIMAVLGRPEEHPEGRFLPETYAYARGSTDLDLLARALQAMDRVLAAEWADRAPDLPLQDPYEALVLASIIEKETARPEERARIAAVFVNRLRRGMRLQTDPTVIYGLGARFDGNLRRRDLRRDTPWNTYTRAGLPPTPIALPGRASIHAALHPATDPALYFVARGDGSHEFSERLEEHERAVRRYQLGRRSGAAP